MAGFWWCPVRTALRGVVARSHGQKTTRKSSKNREDIRKSSLKVSYEDFRPFLGGLQDFENFTVFVKRKIVLKKARKLIRAGIREYIYRIYTKIKNLESEFFYSIRPVLSESV